MPEGHTVRALAPPPPPPPPPQRDARRLDSRTSHGNVDASRQPSHWDNVKRLRSRARGHGH
eukprot:2149119-Prymnesium_polylepis.1